MMIMNPINMEVYEVAQKEIAYAKLFPYILEDFITRKDAIKMMTASNLPVNTAVNTSVNTFVSGTAGSFPVVATGAGSGTGKGTGQTTPVYNGSAPTPQSIAMKAEKQAIVNSGGAATRAALEG